MPRTQPRLFLVAAVVMSVAAAPAADALSTAYQVVGQFGEGAQPTTLDNGSFTLDLVFDGSADADPGLSNFADALLGFAAVDFTLELSPAGADPVVVDAAARPDATGFALFAGEVTGFDTAETRIELGVSLNSDPTLEDRGPTLVELDFLAPELADVFFKDGLHSLPGPLSLVAGSALDEGADRRVPVTAATLTATPSPDVVAFEPPSSGPVGQPGGGPAVVPTPGAAAGGLALLAGLILRSGRRIGRG
ncbi:MAG: hypothetical protein AAFX76_01840 [Planctomycetota bacterium]